MHGNSTRDRLNEEAAERTRIRDREKKTEKLLSRATLGSQPFVVFVDPGAFYENDALRHCQTFEETIWFLLCLLAEIADRIKKKSLGLAEVPDFAVERIIHGVVCQLEIKEVFQLARDFGFISAKGDLQQADVVPSRWEIDLSFLAVATATGGIVRAGNVTNKTPGMNDDWGVAIEKRLKALDC